jgi:putative nucleotidyltransferase with HDIG domain
MADMNELLQRIDRLPAFPAAVARLVPLLGDENVGTDQLLPIVEMDEALSMAVMRLANSAAFGAPGRMFSLRESVVRLGRRRLRALVMEQQTAPLFAKAGSSFGLQRGALWRGALAGAFAAESLARELDEDAPDLFFLCALLRDVGKIVLDLQFGPSYLGRVKEDMSRGLSFVEAEREAVGFDHAELGAGLARRWRLPDRVADAVRFHHDPPSDPPAHDRLFDVVHAADTLCLWAGVSLGGDGLCYRLAEHVRVSLNLDRAAAEEKIVSMTDRLRQAEEELGVAAPTGAAA